MYRDICFTETDLKFINKHFSSFLMSAGILKHSLCTTRLHGPVRVLYAGWVAHVSLFRTVSLKLHFYNSAVNFQYFRITFKKQLIIKESDVKSA